MAVRTTISNGYRLRLGGLTAMVLGFGLFFLFDGLVRYPQQAKHFATFEKYRAHELTDAQGAIVTDWDAYAQKHRLPKESAVTKMNHSSNDIKVQLALGVPLTLIGLWVGFSFVRTFGRWIEVDDNDKLHTSWGQKCDIADVTAIDDARWRSKGIAILKYKDHEAGGIERVLVLDDWKFDRASTDAIFNYVAEKTGLSKVAAEEAQAAAAEADGDDGADDADDVQADDQQPVREDA